MDLIIKINLDNAAFEDARDRELSAIFQRIREDISELNDEGIVRDSNGNRVGNWTVK